MSTSSNAASPTSDGAPRALAPLAPSSTNGLPAASSPPIAGPVTLTNKEWVVPPRPKPGRKPATDTPPTKRKAQNRAAQRAFRERRAAKVGELEEQMKEVEEENERDKEALRTLVQELEEKVAEYRRTILEHQDRLKRLESEVDEERKLRRLAERDLASSKASLFGSTDAVPLPSRQRVGQITPPSDPPQPNERSQVSTEDIPMGCGGCTINSRCECIEQVFNMGNMDNDSSNSPPKRSHSPLSEEHDHKRQRQEDDETPKREHESLEMDFTTRRPPQLSTSSSTFSILAPASNRTSIESCGFCQDGTACLCAELAADNAAANRTGIPSLLTHPSDTSKLVTSINLPNFSYTRSSSSKSACQAGPGTCSQCQNNPSSTLFCKSLAATRTPTTAISPTQPATPTTSAPCDNPAGCCRTNVAVPPSTAHQSTAITGPTLSCADAFTTLSRHPAFDKASGELGIWLPQLSTVPRGMEGRTAFEIEAASVMGVLRFFDRRFGREA